MQALVGSPGCHRSSKASFAPRAANLRLRQPPLAGHVQHSPRPRSPGLAVLGCGYMSARACACAVHVHVQVPDADALSRLERSRERRLLGRGEPDPVSAWGTQSRLDHERPSSKRGTSTREGFRSKQRAEASRTTLLNGSAESLWGSRPRPGVNLKRRPVLTPTPQDARVPNRDPTVRGGPGWRSPIGAPPSAL